MGAGRGPPIYSPALGPVLNRAEIEILCYPGYPPRTPPVPSHTQRPDSHRAQADLAGSTNALQRVQLPSRSRTALYAAAQRCAAAAAAPCATARDQRGGPDQRPAPSHSTSARSIVSLSATTHVPEKGAHWPLLAHGHLSPLLPTVCTVRHFTLVGPCSDTHTEVTERMDEIDAQRGCEFRFDAPFSFRDHAGGTRL